MDIKEYRYMLEIAKKGSFSEAAKTLFVSQPSLSMYIKSLEERLGIVFFDRSKGTLRLTYAGQRYVEYARQIISLNNLLEKELSDIQGLQRGDIHLGISAIRGSYLLPQILPIFHANHPEIEIKLTEGTSSQLEELLVNREIDFAILNYPFQNKNLDFQILYQAEIVLAIPQTYPICSKAKRIEGLKHPWMDLAELQDQKFILLKKGQRIRQIVDVLFDQAGYEPTILLETSSAITTYHLSSAGMGLSFISDEYLKINEKTNLNYYSVGSNQAIWSTAIAYPLGGHLSKASATFINLARELFEE